MGTFERISNECNPTLPSVKRETITHSKNYLTLPNKHQCTGNVCYIRAKSSHRLLRDRINKNNEKKPAQFRYKTRVGNLRSVNAGSSRHLRFVTHPNENKNERIVKVGPATRNSPKCGINNPSHSHTEVVLKLDDGIDGVEKNLRETSESLECGNRKIFTIPPTIYRIT